MFWRTATAIAACLVLQTACGGGDSGSATQSTSSASGGGGATGGGGSATGGGGAGGAATGGAGGAGTGGGGEITCSQALNQALAPVDQVSTGMVKTLSTDGAAKTLYVDASAGGIDDEDSNPWVYLSLKTGTRVDITDTASLTSKAWDLGIKRSLLRTNGGDIGVGRGGAALIDGKTFDQVTSATGAAIMSEHWFDANCNLQTDETGAPMTTFSSWYDYDMDTHVLTPHKGTYVVRGADGALYKLAILDYYATPSGGTMASDGGFFKLEIAALP
jgi:hypothetical protein